MAEVDLVKHFGDLASACRRLTNVLEETWDILEDKDENDWRINDLANAVDGLKDVTRELDGIVFGMMLDAEDDLQKEEDNG
jgi:hypothetical protein